MVVHEPGELRVAAGVLQAHRLLQAGDGLGIPQVPLAVDPEVQVAALLQHLGRIRAEGQLVPGQGLPGQVAQAHAAQAGGGAGEVLVDDELVDADGLEDLGALVAAQGADAHLGHGLEQALLEGLDVVLGDLVRGEVAREQVLGAQLPDGGQGQVGVHRPGAVAQQQSHVGHLPGLAGFHHEPGPDPGAFPDQVVVHGRGGQQAGDGRAGLVHAPVAEDQEAEPVGDGPAGGTAEVAQGLVEVALGVPFHLEQHGQGDAAEVGEDIAPQLGQVLAGEERVGQFQHVALARGRLQQVALAAHAAHQRHHDLLPERVDGRIGHLGEVLLEVAEQQLGLLRQHRQGDVDAHGTHRLLAAHGHGAEHQAQVLLGVAEGVLQPRQFLGPHRVLHRGRGQGGQADLVLGQPFRVRLRAGHLALDLLVRDHAAFLGVHQEHLAGLEPALLLDPGGVDVQHPEFAGHDHQAVGGDHPLGRAQAVAVQGGADEPAVGEGQGGGPVPGLQEVAVVLVEGLLLRGHVRIVAPGLGHQHHHHVGQAAAPGQAQEVGHLVQGLGIGGVRPGDGAEVLHHVAAEGFALEHGFPGGHPGQVAAQGVDLAVVGQQPVGVGPLPGREGVGGEPGMDQGQPAFGAGVGQVRVEGGQLLGQHEPLVDEGAGRAGADVERIEIGDLAGPLTDGAEHPLEGLRGALAADDELAEGGHGVPGRGPQGALHHRGGAPADDGLAVVHDRPLQHRHVVAAAGRIRGEEAHGHGVVPRGRQGDPFGRHLLRQQPVGNLQQDAGAVPGERVAAGGAPVGEVLQDLQPLAHDAVAGLPAEGGHEAQAAGVMFEGGIVEALTGGQRHGALPRDGAPDDRAEPDADPGPGGDPGSAACGLRMDPRFLGGIGPLE